MRVLIRVVLMLGSLLLAGCSLSEKTQPVVLSGIAFHSMTWTVKLAALPDGKDAATARAELQQLLEVANAVLSTYQADTELMRFNGAPAGQWVAVSPLLFNAVREAQAVSVATGGRYDVTVGPLVNLWGFGPDAVPVNAPDAAAIAAARARMGYQKVALDASRRAMKHEADVQMDLSSVGEGVAVDALAARLATWGVRDYLVSVAGCSRAQGKRPDGRDWVLAIEASDGSGGVQQVLRLANRSVSTSGSYRNYREIDGVRYSHTLDPATGQPIRHKGVSVTVVSGEAARADAWATALNVLGPDEGHALAESRQIPAYFIYHTDKGPAVRYTTAFRSFLPAPGD